MKLPPLPKWNKATDDIDTGEFFARAQDYERSFLPSGIAFPRTGQIWEAMRDCQVNFVASFSSALLLKPAWPGCHPPESAAPIPFGQSRLAQGERVRVEFAEDSKPLAVWFQPLRYDELHESIVPAEVRNAPGYLQYRLILRTAPTLRWLHEASDYFTEAFRLIEDVA